MFPYTKGITTWINAKLHQISLNVPAKNVWQKSNYKGIRDDKEQNLGNEMWLYTESEYPN